MTIPLLDPSVVSELAESMGLDFAQELVTTFLDDAPNMIAQLKDAVSNQDADAYRRAAHSIKSNAEVFGAKALTSQARGMELGDLSEGATAVPTLEAIFTQTAAQLQDIL